MADNSTAREAWITGIGIVSCLGEGPDAHWQGLSSGKPAADSTTYPPYIIHKIGALDFDKQIPKKGDQRQMEPWQRIGTYAAGLALDSAGIKGNTEILSRTDMIVAAGGGERDINADTAILSGLPTAEKPEAFLNERLMSDLRPTLFLAQLSNLLAGNISIVHGVIGSSRTFMGEESAGVDAVRIAHSRIVAGQSDIALVGGSHNAERPDLLMLYEFGGFALKDQFAPVWKREAHKGLALASLGAFLVIESRAHADARGARRIAKLSAVLSDRTRRQPGDIGASLGKLWGKISGKLTPGKAAVISGASGVAAATAEERAFLAEHKDIAVRATGTYLGHAFEPQFPMNVALAAIAVSRGSLYPPGDDSGVERAMEAPLTQAVVTSIGHWRGEGLALVEAP
ncbi:beta-ketoacyl-ACP synthase [Rhodoplanes sp. Z2-YC6860]|uniref:beta-ketoacyl-ACP synthase n=1 Tax=Rhodoplanes sp. Z2-YC6860 TaxID=674703 RepID=UPI00078DCB0A|nr:beta-ketoacyl-ACP synthase [Rhodoplanes sp. Z2-YC6860]AMN41650.1 3-oxoacyl-(acyl-carrier-protein) synthase [Rhodoplanes sp. Z2-YC6860]